MAWPIGKGTLGVYVLLVTGALVVCFWQRAEHQRFERNAAEALVNRGRDITSTLGVVVRSQRRSGGIVSKARIQSALQDLMRPGEMESIAILSGAGETIASAGKPVELTREMLQARGIHWREQTLTLMNLMDLGADVSEDHTRPPSTIVVSDTRAFFRGSQLQNRRPAENFSRPSWMSKEEYDSVIQKQGVHSLVICLPTAAMRKAVQTDMLLRMLVSGLAVAAAVFFVLAWRNVRKNSELQIRLVKAGEMNTHLTEMNFAAAGLAHETRNPLNLIRGLAQMITMEAPAPSKLKAHASTIIEEADRVTVQLNEFIHYSKPREAHPAPVEMARLAGDITRTLQADIEEKQLRIELLDTPLVVQADEALFRQAVFNLLLNAIQAVSSGGKIFVRWSVTGDEATLEIADDGPGVPTADRTAIFKPYVTMRPKGVGLGLAIVQQIVLAHGWTIMCEGNEPQGAIFRIAHLKVARDTPSVAS
ncbi:MAG: ATP-binding protein [Verrucomicrobiota bacterium]